MRNELVLLDFVDKLTACRWLAITPGFESLTLRLLILHIVQNTTIYINTAEPC
jgi:hypothetical protein